MIRWTSTPWMPSKSTPIARSKPVICTEQQLNQLHSSLYGTYGGIGGVLEDMEDMEIDKGAEKAATLEDVEVSSLQGMAEEAPVVRLVNSILSQGIREGASDIHISPEKDNVQVRFRVDGKLHEVPAPPKSMFLPIISRLKILANMDIAVSRIPQDGRFTVKMKNKDINIRASTIPSIYGENMVLRLLDTSTSIYSLERLGMTDADRKKLEAMIHKPYGMILSTGPTGSGKSTSLYSILKVINQPDINIITVEDPVEYRIEKIRQVQLNRKAGMTFASGLRSILRQDPDVIMVGEIRDARNRQHRRPGGPHRAPGAEHPAHQRCRRRHDATDRHGCRTVSGGLRHAGILCPTAGAPGLHPMQGALPPDR